MSCYCKVISVEETVQSNNKTFRNICSTYLLLTVEYHYFKGSSFLIFHYNLIFEKKNYFQKYYWICLLKACTLNMKINDTISFCLILLSFTRNKTKENAEKFAINFQQVMMLRECNTNRKIYMDCFH